MKPEALERIRAVKRASQILHAEAWHAAETGGGGGTTPAGGVVGALCSRANTA